MEKKKTQKLLSEETTRLIGIGGAGDRVGCTHFAVMLGNYLTGYCRRRAALLEWNLSGDFGNMERICTGVNRPEKPYRVLEADYYKEAGSRELADALSNHYNDILIDFGTLEEAAFAEFLRCDLQFVLGSFSEWQEHRFREFVRFHKTGKQSWKYLAAFGSEETRREFKRRPGVYVERIPFSADAFSITTDFGQFLKHLLEPEINP